jgi:hypothetical protein
LQTASDHDNGEKAADSRLGECFMGVMLDTIGQLIAAT